MRLIINEIDYTKNILTPIKTQNVRDESLDQGILTLTNMLTDVPFEPLTEVYLDNETWLVGKDNVTQTKFGGKPKYTHEIGLIEETKLLEKYFVDTMTFRNSLGGGTEETFVYPEISDQTKGKLFGKSFVFENEFGIVETYLSPIESGTLFTFKKYADIINVNALVPINNRIAYMTIYKDGAQIYNSGAMLIQDLPEYTTTLENGTYVVSYIHQIPSFSGIKTIKVSYTIRVADVIEEYNKKTLADVVDKILLLAEIPRKGDFAKFYVNEKQYAELATIEAPEFNITNSTLREALNKVGDYIHAEVRLKNGEIWFDYLGTKEKAEIKKQPVAFMSSQDVEQFCSEIDGTVSNLVTSEEGMIEPYYNGYITPRTETGTVRIEESNCFIPTRYKIQNIIKVEVGFTDAGITGTSIKVGDITEYVVEKSVYDTMSSYSSDVIEESKAFHIYWQKDNKGIKGLNFEQKNILGGAFEEYAISNIINNKLGLPFDRYNFEASLLKLQFRITYVPVIEARLKQHKTYLKNKKSVLSYSQSDYKINSSSYGENMKGAVARLGNIEKTLTYIYKNNEQMPKVGTLFDDNYYISAVLREQYKDISKVSLVLNKDFNRLNEYVGINNEQRFYEIPVENVVERYSVYEDYLIIGDFIPENDTEQAKNSLASTGLLYALRLNFTNESGPFDGAFRIPVSHAIINTYNKGGVQINDSKISLPVISYPFGNSAVFNFSFQDNYGAGDYVPYFKSSALGLQDQVRYTNRNGEFEYLSFSLYGVTYASENSTSVSAEFVEPADFSEAVEIGSKLPKETPIANSIYLAPHVSTIDYFDPLQQNIDYPIQLRKDSAENINITYQINCVTTDENIVIGSGLPKALGVKKWDSWNDECVKCYILDNKVRNLENIIDNLPNNDVSYTMSVSLVSRQIRMGSITANKNGNCVAFVNSNTRELMFAINMEVEDGQTIELPNLQLRHKIYD